MQIGLSLIVLIYLAITGSLQAQMLPLAFSLAVFFFIPKIFNFLNFFLSHLFFVIIVNIVIIILVNMITNNHITESVLGYIEISSGQKKNILVHYL